MDPVLFQLHFIFRYQNILYFRNYFNIILILIACMRIKINENFSHRWCWLHWKHVSNYFIDRGHEVTIIDNLSTGSIKNLPKKATFIKMIFLILER